MIEATAIVDARPVLRGPDGKFRVGTRAGPGSPFAAETGRLRAKVLRSIRQRDVARAIEVIREILNDPKARHTDRLAAARELLDRAIGRPRQDLAAEMIALTAEDDAKPILNRAMLAESELALLVSLQQRIAERTTCPTCNELGKPCELHANPMERTQC